MEYAFAYLTFAFGGMLLLYAVILAMTRDVRMIPRSYAAQMDNPREYARKFAGFLALIALACIGAGCLSLAAGPAVGGIVLVPALVLAFWAGLRMMKE